MADMDTLVEIKDLHTYFYLAEGVVRAVDGVDLTIKRGRTLGVVGESGCGKSITSLSLLQLVPPPGKIESGEILFYKPVQAKWHQRDGRCGQYRGSRPERQGDPRYSRQPHLDGFSGTHDRHDPGADDRSADYRIDHSASRCFQAGGSCTSHRHAGARQNVHGRSRSSTIIRSS